MPSPENKWSWRAAWAEPGPEGEQDKRAACDELGSESEWTIEGKCQQLMNDPTAPTPTEEEQILTELLA